MTQTPELLAGLDAVERTGVLALASPITLSPGEVLFRLGTDATSLYLIERGLIALTMPMQIGAVHGDIDDPRKDADRFDLLDEVGEALGNVDAAQGNADQGDFGEVWIALDDLVREPLQAAAEIPGIEHQSGARCGRVAGGKRR